MDRTEISHLLNVALQKKSVDIHSPAARAMYKTWVDELFGKQYQVDVLKKALQDFSDDTYSNTLGHIHLKANNILFREEREQNPANVWRKQFDITKAKGPNWEKVHKALDHDLKEHRRTVDGHTRVVKDSISMWDDIISLFEEHNCDIKEINKTKKNRETQLRWLTGEEI